MCRLHQKEPLAQTAQKMHTKALQQFKLSLDCQRGSRWHNSLYTAFPSSTRLRLTGSVKNFTLVAPAHQDGPPKERHVAQLQEKRMGKVDAAIPASRMSRR